MHPSRPGATCVFRMISGPVQPWLVETFKFSTDSQLVGKVTDVVGLFLAPPENTIVLCVDTKSQIQALDPGLLT